MQSAVQSCKLEQGEFLCRTAEPIERMYFLIEGRLKIFMTLSNGRSLLQRFVNPLSIIGEVEFITRNAVGSNVQAIMPCTLLALPYDELDRHSRRKPELLSFLMKQLCHKIETMNHSTSVNLLYPLNRRLAAYLSSTMLDEHLNPYTHELKTSNLSEIADLLGASYRHVNRAIADFIAKGIVERKNGKLVIRDASKLKRLAPIELYR